jgi:hypothetical protein
MGFRGADLLKWVKAVLTTHAAYLMAVSALLKLGQLLEGLCSQNPKLVTALGTLYQLIESRISTYGRLSKLQGKLNLLMTQVSSQEESQEDREADHKPLLMYQDGERDFLLLLSSHYFFSYSDDFLSTSFSFSESSEDEFPIEEMIGEQDAMEVICFFLSRNVLLNFVVQSE